jgi:hypothetical protein
LINRSRVLLSGCDIGHPLNTPLHLLLLSLRGRWSRLGWLHHLANFLGRGFVLGSLLLNLLLLIANPCQLIGHIGGIGHLTLSRISRSLLESGLLHCGFAWERIGRFSSDDRGWLFPLISCRGQHPTYARHHLTHARAQPLTNRKAAKLISTKHASGFKPFLGSDPGRHRSATLRKLIRRSNPFWQIPSASR